MSREKAFKHKSLGKNLARRNQPIVPVGAWVELAARPQFSDTEVFVSAQVEEDRISCRQREKAARLEQFQKDVRERVREAHRRRREQRLQESSQAVDLHQRILQRGKTSSHKAEIYRDQQIQISSDHEETSGSQEENVDPDHLINLSQKIGGLVMMAKRDLASRRVMAEKSNLPGGMWGQSFSRDTLEPQVHLSENEPPLPPMNTQMVSYDASPGYPGALPHPGTSSHPETSPNPRILSDLPGSTGDFSAPRQSGGQTTDITQGIPLPQEKRSKTVTFDPELQSGSSKTSVGQVDRIRTRAPKSSAEDGERAILQRGQGETVARHLEVMNPQPHTAENERRRMGEEVSAYRRLYMDMEREAVRENRRKIQHSKHIQKLKKAKEEERLAVEGRSRAASEPTDPSTGLTGGELIEERQHQERRMEAEMERIKRREKRCKEEERYISALRAQMKEKVDALGIVLPPLCPCGPTAWDCNPDTCANNCIFYRNPKAYAKALASLLNSSEFG